MIELHPPNSYGFVFATSNECVDHLTVTIDGPGRSGLSPFRDFLAPGCRAHVATLDGPATVTLASGGYVVASGSFAVEPVRRRVRANRPRRFGSPW